MASQSLLRRLSAIMFTLATSCPGVVAAQGTPRIHVVYMGGNDCPPCITWRALEYPKLAATDVFKRIQFTHVEKTIRSTVPPKFFLPKEVKPLKEKLDYAANKMTGSAQIAIVVDGEVFHYQFGGPAATELEAWLIAIESGEPYPFPRCTRRIDSRSCAESK